MSLKTISFLCALVGISATEHVQFPHHGARTLTKLTSSLNERTLTKQTLCIYHVPFVQCTTDSTAGTERHYGCMQDILARYAFHMVDPNQDSAGGKNRPYSYSRYWTGTSLQWRIKTPPHQPHLQASSSPIPGIRIWPIVLP